MWSSSASCFRARCLIRSASASAGGAAPLTSPSTSISRSLPTCSYPNGRRGGTRVTKAVVNLRAGFIPTHQRESRVVQNVLEIVDLGAAKRHDDERGSDAHVALDAALRDERGFHPCRPKARDRDVGRPV